MKTRIPNIYEKLNETPSKNIHDNWSTFLLTPIPKERPIEDIAKEVQLKVSELVQEFSIVWDVNIEKNEEDYTSLSDFFEGVIMKNLYGKVFCSTSDEKAQNYEFERQVTKLQFMKYEYWDINESVINDVYIHTAINKLAMINQYKCPKDKIATIINFCNIWSMMIISKSNDKNRAWNSNGSNGDSERVLFAGADEVLPIVVYTLIKGNIKKLKSNIKYIRLFRHSTLFESNKDEYFTTVLESAVKFIEDINENSSWNINKTLWKTLIRDSQSTSETFKPLRLPQNADECYWLYYWTDDANKDGNALDSNSNSINNPIELNDVPNNININNATTLDKKLLSKSKGWLDINVDKWYSEYFTKDLKRMPQRQLQKMVNDFKLAIIWADDYINNTCNK